MPLGPCCPPSNAPPRLPLPELTTLPLPHVCSATFNSFRSMPSLLLGLRQLHAGAARACRRPALHDACRRHESGRLVTGKVEHGCCCGAALQRSERLQRRIATASKQMGRQPGVGGGIKGEAGAAAATFCATIKSRSTPRRLHTASQRPRALTRASRPMALRRGSRLEYGPYDWVSEPRAATAPWALGRVPCRRRRSPAAA